MRLTVFFQLRLRLSLQNTAELLHPDSLTQSGTNIEGLSRSITTPQNQWCGRRMGIKITISHPAVFNAALCDGSVRALNYNIDPVTWARLGSRNDRGVLDSSSL